MQTTDVSCPNGWRWAVRSQRRATILLLGLLSCCLVGQSKGDSASFESTGSLITARSYHTATLLPKGTVLVAGGFGDGYFDGSAEIYTPTDGTFTATASLTTARYHYTATLLSDGKVLAAGGGTAIDITLYSAELYDPATATWIATGNLMGQRQSHTATLLAHGKVLVAAGFVTDSYGGPDGTYIATAELYDPPSGTWTATGSLITARSGHKATLLTSGKVLVAGGYNNIVGALASAELYDPATGAWTTTGSLNTARSGHTATLLPNGKVL